MPIVNYLDKYFTYFGPEGGWIEFYNTNKIQFRWGSAVSNYTDTPMNVTSHWNLQFGYLFYHSSIGGSSKNDRITGLDSTVGQEIRAAISAKHAAEPDKGWLNIFGPEVELYAPGADYLCGF